MAHHGPSATGNAGSVANAIYILYLVSLAFGLTGLIGVVIAYMNQEGAPAWVASHYRFQIRTFWIGLLIAVIGGLLALILIGWLVLIGLAVWLVLRCVKGMTYLGRGQPIPDATTWMIP